MQRARLAAAAAVTVLAVLTTAGCSDGEEPAPAPAAPVGAHPAPLVGELAHVRSTDASRAWTAFGDLAAQRALGDGTVPEQLAPLTTHGWSTTAARHAQARAELGLDGSRARQAVEVGRAAGAGRFDGGVDTAAVAAGAKGLGGRRDGTVGGFALWRLGPDDSTRLPRAVAELSRGTADFNVLATGSGTVLRAQSRARAALLTARGGTGSLARDPGFRAVAECLGRPLAATLTDDHVVSGGPSPKPAGFTTGAGVRGTDAGHLTQVACRTTGSREEAEETAEALRHELAHGRTRLSRLPWRTLLAGAEVRVLDGPGHVVETTATSTKSPGLALEMMRSGDLSDLMDTGH